jgi:hypothetical protein
MQNKNPQGNFDPIPDSDQELEKYGVWVKAEPQDLVEEPETDHQPLANEDDASLETMEELSGGMEDLEEILDLDTTDGEESESIDLSDFGLDEPEDAVVDDQGFDSLDLDMDLDEALSNDTVSDDEETAFDFDLPEETSQEASLDFETDELEAMESEQVLDDSGLDSFTIIDDDEELLPEIEMENVEMEDELIQDELMQDELMENEHSAPSFDDVGALEEDLASTSPSENTVSSDLLQKIALELSSIKEELVSLRSQLGELKREPVPVEVENQETDEDGTKGGFFDDEDDDTIALTGDELDNILNTADFTVEPPEDLTTPDILEETEDFEAIGGLVDTGSPSADWMEESQDLLPEDGSYLSGENTEDTDTSGLEDHSTTLEPGIEAIEGDEALDLDFENDDETSPPELDPEINVITESPEDTSYLDEDASELADGFELDASPLEEVPLMEPDLTELDLGIEIDDALAAESTEDLPFMESADTDDGELILEEESEALSDQVVPEADQTSLETDLASIEEDDFDSILELDEADDEIVLSIDGDEQLGSSDASEYTEALDEIEEVEPLSMDPFEDETISELELHREGPRQADGSWSSEPEDLSELEEPEEVEAQSSQATEAKTIAEVESEAEVLEDFESMDFEGEGLLGSQEVEDLGGEDLETLEELEDLSEVDEVAGEAPSIELEPELMELEPELMEEEPELIEEEPELIEEEPELIEEEPELIEEATPVEEPGEAVAMDVTEELDSGITPETEEAVPDKLKQDVKSVLLYLDQLLASLPEEKIEEFASSEYYDTYKKLFEDLGLL